MSPGVVPEGDSRHSRCSASRVVSPYLREASRGPPEVGWFAGRQVPHSGLVERQEAWTFYSMAIGSTLGAIGILLALVGGAAESRLELAANLTVLVLTAGVSGWAWREVRSRTRRE